jgi:NhaA family Na+:H+ antiporter
MPKFKLRRTVQTFFKTEASSGVLLAACAVIAMAIANSPYSDSYFYFLDLSLFGISLQHWINDGLMTVFFFVVGMEIKRELVAGELSSMRKAALPLAAAMGGMLAPALIYYFFNPDGPAARGWAVPMATDIAFALGVLSLLGKRVPLALKIFLLALAIVDDLGAVMVIALFFTEKIRLLGLAGVAAGVSALVLARKAGLRSYFVYLLVGTFVWAAMFYSGVHATVAGVLLGFLTPALLPAQDPQLESSTPLEDLIHLLHPWVGFVIMPIFALANAGVVLHLNSTLLESPVSMGVGLGLLLGKPVGIMMAVFLVTMLGLAELPRDLKRRQLLGVACLAGIGFTMAIFLTNLSLVGELATMAKTVILATSVAAGAVGYFILSMTLGPPSR